MGKAPGARRQAPGARPIPQRLSHATLLTGFDRHSVRSATQKVAYVACSRGREDIEVFVESVADPSKIQNRSGGRGNGFRQCSKRAGRGQRTLSSASADPGHESRSG
jgi:hypothetical protein